MNERMLKSFIFYVSGLLYLKHFLAIETLLIE